MILERRHSMLSNHNLSVCTWNVGGLKKFNYDKTKDPTFIKEISCYDIVLLTETHLGYDSFLDIPGYNYTPICRPKSKNNRYFGGLGILIKSNIKRGIEILKNQSVDYQWIRLDKNYFHFTRNIFLCLAYIIPATSHYAGQMSIDVLSCIENDIINNYSDKGHIMICGDLNARTGSELDFIPNDLNDVHQPIDPEYESDLVLQCRKSYDAKVDERGKQILEMCISQKLRILNGRMFGDTLGKFTCYKPNGNSVVDYVIMSEDLMETTLNFRVSNFIPILSDCHSKLSFLLLASYPKYYENNDDNTTLFPGRYVWTDLSKVKFQDALCHPSTKSIISNFMKNNFQSEEVDKAAHEFKDILLNAGNLSLKIKRPKHKRKQNINKKQKKWYDQDLFNKKQTVLQKGALISKYPFDMNIRNNYFKHYREYKKLKKFKEKNFKLNLVHKMDTLRENNPKAYWDLINQLKHIDNNSDHSVKVEGSIWHNYFKKLNTLTDPQRERQDEIYKLVEDLENNDLSHDLDEKISDKEIAKAIKKLKSGKSSGLDLISNEMIKAGQTALMPCLSKLFNLILSSTIYPKNWGNGYLTPIFKSGDPTNPENYRGIVINSCLGKLFNIILHDRLYTYLENKHLLSNKQAGFRRKSRTTDHMFIIKCLIDKYTQTANKKLYACFIDFRKAFDSVLHAGILMRLLQNNVGGNFYKIIKNLYNHNNICVKSENFVTPTFKSHIGVRQGDVLSPTLFNVFINELPNLMDSCPDSVSLYNDDLSCLLYADDVVIFSSSAYGLQCRLNILAEYCKNMCLDINVKKSNIIIFNKSGRFLREPFYFNSKTVECVNKYKYLGLIFQASGLFNYGKEELFNKAAKASFKLSKLLSPTNPSINTLLHLYDHTVKPILLYSSEIWGIFKTNSVACTRDDPFPFEKIFENNISDKSNIKFCKYILGVHKKSSNIAVLSELGRFPLYFNIITYMILYLHRLYHCESTLLQDALQLAKKLHNDNKHSWYSSVIFLLKKLDISEEFCKTKSVTVLKTAILKNLKSKFLLHWQTQRSISLEKGKLDTYFKFKNIFEKETYLSCKTFQFRQVICKLRISAHNLKIESARYSHNRTERAQRICDYCNLQQTENEIHFITECPLYLTLREDLYKTVDCYCKNFKDLNNFDKFLWLMITEDHELLEKFGNYIYNCFKLRAEQVNRV